MFKAMLRTGLFFLLLLPLLSGCRGIGPSAIGEAAAELIYLVPGDKIQLETGEVVYVDGDGRLQGIEEVEMIAAGVKARDVMMEVRKYRTFERYNIVEYGKRYIEVAGEVDRTGRYRYPLDEDWSIMNLLMNIQGFRHDLQAREYLLVRRAWAFPNAYLFLRGQAVPALEGIGGDDILIFSGDTVLFPGKTPFVYVFGGVKKRAICFSFAHKPPNLKIAMEQAGGYFASANLQDIQVYRLFAPGKQSIFHLTWEKEQDFPLQSWDIVYVPFAVPARKQAASPN